MIEAGDGLLVVGQTLLDVQASAEALALIAAIQQDNADVVVLIDQPLSQLGQVRNQAVGQSVVRLGSVQGDLQDVGLDHLEQQVLVRGQLSSSRIHGFHSKNPPLLYLAFEGPLDLFNLRRPAHRGRPAEATKQ